MLIDRNPPPGDTAVSRRTSLAKDGEPGEKTDAPKPAEEAPKPKSPDPEEDDALDEELDESFPASDPPASTQP